MTHIAVIGAGITGVTTAYALAQRGYRVTVLDRQRYAAMETSFANGGQLSACNAEVWNKLSTVLHGVQWMMRRDAPLLMNPTPSWHKLSWMAAFMREIAHYRQNTVATVRLALKARTALFAMAEAEGIDFDLKTRGILHFYRDRASFEKATAVNALLREGGLERYAVTPEEIRAIEPTLAGTYHGGFFTPSDATGDIHKFTRGLAAACARKGVRFVQDADVATIAPGEGGYAVGWRQTGHADGPSRAAGPAGRRGGDLRGLRQPALRGTARGPGQRLPGEGLLDHREPADPGGAEGGARGEHPRRGGQDRHQPPRRRAPAGRRHGRVQRLQPRHPPRPDPAAGRLDPGAVPAVDTDRVVAWSGLRPMLPNMLPKVGRGRRPGVFYNTGHGHLGWTLSGATAELVAEAIAAEHAPERTALPLAA